MSRLLDSFAASLAAEAELHTTAQSDLALPPRHSIWSQVCAALRPAERDEARLLIGAQRIKDNETLLSEAHSLLQIIGDLDQQHAHAHAHSAQSSSTQSLQLLETPSKFHLRLEISSLLHALRERAQSKDADVQSLWSPSTLRSSQIAQSIARDNDRESSTRSQLSSSRSLQSRPQSAWSDRACTSVTRTMSDIDPSLPVSRPASCSTGRSSSPSLALSSSLSIFTIDVALSRIRAALASEHDALLEDVAFLQSHLEHVAIDQQRREELAQVQPSESELRALRGELAAAVKADEEHEKLELLMGTASRKCALWNDHLTATIDATSLASSNPARISATVSNTIDDSTIEGLLASIAALDQLAESEPSPAFSQASDAQSADYRSPAEILVVEHSSPVASSTKGSRVSTVIAAAAASPLPPLARSQIKRSSVQSPTPPTLTSAVSQSPSPVRLQTATTVLRPVTAPRRAMIVQQ